MDGKKNIFGTGVNFNTASLFGKDGLDKQKTQGGSNSLFGKDQDAKPRQSAPANPKKNEGSGAFSPFGVHTSGGDSKPSFVFGSGSTTNLFSNLAKPLGATNESPNPFVNLGKPKQPQKSQPQSKQTSSPFSGFSAFVSTPNPFETKKQPEPEKSNEKTAKQEAKEPIKNPFNLKGIGTGQNSFATKVTTEKRDQKPFPTSPFGFTGKDTETSSWLNNKETVKPEAKPEIKPEQKQKSPSTGFNWLNPQSTSTEKWPSFKPSAQLNTVKASAPAPAPAVSPLINSDQGGHGKKKGPPPVPISQKQQAEKLKQAQKRKQNEQYLKYIKDKLLEAQKDLTKQQQLQTLQKKKAEIKKNLIGQLKSHPPTIFLQNHCQQYDKFFLDKIKHLQLENTSLEASRILLEKDIESINQEIKRESSMEAFVLQAPKLQKYKASMKVEDYFGDVVSLLPPKELVELRNQWEKLDRERVKLEIQVKDKENQCKDLQRVRAEKLKRFSNIKNELINIFEQESEFERYCATNFGNQIARLQKQYSTLKTQLKSQKSQVRPPALSLIL